MASQFQLHPDNKGTPAVMNTKHRYLYLGDRDQGVSATHLFEVGQSVRLKNGLGGKNMSVETYRITSKVPVSGGFPQYRIRCENEPYERVAAQDLLEPVGGGASDPNRSLIEKTFGS
ncbi:hypothetical protein [Roseibium sp. M-1]